MAEVIIALHRREGEVSCSCPSSSRREALSIGDKIELPKMGRIEIRRTKKAKLHAAFVDLGGNFVISCDLNKDGTFNFHRNRGRGGHRYWFAKAPIEALAKIVVKRGLPKNILRRANCQPVELQLERDKLGKFEYVVTDGQVQNSSVPTNGDPRKVFVHGGTFAIVVSESGTWTDDLGYGGEELNRWFERIYVRENCDPGALSLAIQSVRQNTARLG